MFSSRIIHEAYRYFPLPISKHRVEVGDLMAAVSASSSGVKNRLLFWYFSGLIARNIGEEEGGGGGDVGTRLLVFFKLIIFGNNAWKRPDLECLFLMGLELELE